MPKSLTEEEIRNRIHDVHQDRIVLDARFEFTGTKKSSTFLCGVDNTHGYFEARVDTLYRTNPSGCPRCGLIKQGLSRRSDTERFIQDARSIHGDKYDYTKVNYVKSNIKVVIICEKGHEFQMTPNHHLKGENCKECYLENKKRDLQNLIQEAMQIHSDEDGNPKFDYTLILPDEYIDTVHKVPIKCKNCESIFHQTFNAHVHLKQGCLQCFRSRRN